MNKVNVSGIENGGNLWKCPLVYER